MVTALDQPSDKVQGLEAGADDFLTKPVDDIAAEAWKAYKSGYGPGRASPRTEGFADGAEACAKAIRAAGLRPGARGDVDAAGGLDGARPAIQDHLAAV